MFLFKKLVSPALFPVPIILFILLVGLVLMWTSRDPLKHRGRPWVTVGVLLLLVLSLRPIPLWTVESLESKYPIYQPETGPADVGWIVVLAGGVSDDPTLDDFHRLSTSTMMRLVEGIRLQRMHPQARLLMSGGSPFTTISGAEVMRQTAIDLGVDSAVIAVEDQSLDTKDQALSIGSYVGDSTFILVTSAYHMPRSMALFQKQGLVPIPAPTHHIVKKSQKFHPGALYPSSINLYNLRQGVREYLGLTWARLRGQI